MSLQWKTWLDDDWKAQRSLACLVLAAAMFVIAVVMLAMRPGQWVGLYTFGLVSVLFAPFGAHFVRRVWARWSPTHSPLFIESGVPAPGPDLSGLIRMNF